MPVAPRGEAFEVKSLLVRLAIVGSVGNSSQVLEPCAICARIRKTRVERLDFHDDLNPSANRPRDQAYVSRSERSYFVERLTLREMRDNVA